jgi:hypothetical protein
MSVVLMACVAALTGHVLGCLAERFGGPEARDALASGGVSLLVKERRDG